MPKISVIVPVYNSEKYLRRCIDSLLTQSFTNFEIIAVNDGSTDNSLEILREYKAKDSRIIVIDKPNEGVSATRNCGIEVAKGEYIMFCDSDDFVHPQFCELLLDAAANNNEDFVVCGSKRTNNSSIDKRTYSLNEYQNVSYYYLFQYGLTAPIWNKIYKTKVIKDNNIKFDTSFLVAEDVLFNSRYLQYCKGCVFINHILYYYYNNESSALHKYYPDWLRYHLYAFYCRIPYIEEKHISEYCDIWLYSFIHMLDNIHDNRNPMPWFQQMRYNQKMLRSKEFTYCIDHASGNNESPKIIRLLKMRNYYLYWLLTKSRKQENDK